MNGGSAHLRYTGRERLKQAAVIVLIVVTVCIVDVIWAAALWSALS